MAQKKKNLTGAQKLGLGVALTAAAAAAAGSYFLYGSKDAAKNRKRVKGWALKAKGEVLEAIEKAGNMTEEEYHALIDTVTKAYGTAKKVGAGEAKEFKDEMKQHWKHLVSHAKAKAPKKAAKPKAKKK
jgi:hypothetical protein